MICHILLNLQFASLRDQKLNRIVIKINKPSKP